MKPLPPIVLQVCGLSALALLAGCAEIPGASQGSVSRPAPSTDVGKLQAWQDAEHVASVGEGRETVIGSGDSMKPIYGEGTVLVVTKIDYADLKPGMQVAYLNAANRRVVHVLIEPDARGWRVQGLNNDSEDKERVTRRNLIGVVYASFATDQN